MRGSKWWHWWNIPLRVQKEFIIHQQNPYSETFLLWSLRTTKWLDQTSFTELQRELTTIWLWHWCDFQELFLHYCCSQSIAALLTSYSLPQRVTRPAPLISPQPADRIGSVRVATYLPGFGFTCSKMVGVTKSAMSCLKCCNCDRSYTVRCHDVNIQDTTVLIEKRWDPRDRLCSIRGKAWSLCANVKPDLFHCWQKNSPECVQLWTPVTFYDWKTDGI